LVKYRPGILKLKALRVLYEKAEDGRVYEWNELLKLLVGSGVNENYARLLLWDFYLFDILERPRWGRYRVNKARLKDYMDSYEAMIRGYLERKAKVEARGGSSGPAPSQEGA
jgi:hypothetical protein